MVPVRHGALRGVGGEIGPEPLLLGAARAHVDVAVERDHVPGPEIVAVVTLSGIARRRAEIAEVAGCARRQVVLVARRGSGARDVPPPRGSVAVGIVGTR